jgi:drug/metabolite transporter (DMT)-like permease
LVASLVRGGPSLDFGAVAWGWLVAVALVSTVASILSVLEPVVTVASAAAVVGESLSQTQLLGGALVLAAVLVVQWPARGVAVSRHVGRVPGTAL